MSNWFSLACLAWPNLPAQSGFLILANPFPHMGWVCKPVFWIDAFRLYLKNGQPGVLFQLGHQVSNCLIQGILLVNSQGNAFLLFLKCIVALQKFLRVIRLAHGEHS